MASNSKGKLRRSATMPETSRQLPPAVVQVDSKGYMHTKKVTNYLVGGELGEGSFAKVKEAFHVLVGEKVAMKIIDKKKAMQDAYVAKNFKREAKLLQKLNHPNIIKLYEVIETDNNYYLITELCSGGELMAYIYKHKHLGEEETRKFVRQIVSAVDHLHKAGMIHRDLKVENLMLDSNKNIRLIDFGLSNEEISFDESGNEIHCRTQCGSPAYAAPELLGQREYDKGVDIWSIGVNMYAMLVGDLPYKVEPFNITALHAKMLQNKMNPIPDWVSDNCRDLLKRLLVAKPEERITMEEIFVHPWLNEDLKLPFLPRPYPNNLKSENIQDSIIDHMSSVLEVGIPIAIKQDLLANRATSLYAVYCLLESRLARYNKEFSTKTIKQRTKKKVSRDHGFYDDDENSSDASSTVTAPPMLGRPTGSGGVVYRQRRNPIIPLNRSRPTSDDFTNKSSTLPVYSGGRRRLSDIAEDRRNSVPEDILKKELQKIRDKKTSATVLSKTISPNKYERLSNPQPATNQFPHQYLSEMSPPSDPCEFDMLSHSHQQKSTRFSSPIKKRSLPSQLNKFGQVNTAAWGSNPPSRAASRQSSLSTMPPIVRNRNSLSMDSSDNDELEFHDVPISPTTVNDSVSFFMDTPPPTEEHLHLPAVTKRKSPRRRNGWVISNNGDCTIRTEMQVAAIISEILRTAHDMKMKSEPQLANTVRCEHKSVTFEIGVRKNSTTSCMLHFDWMQGGSLKQFNEICSEVVQRVHL